MNKTYAVSKYLGKQDALKKSNELGKLNQVSNSQDSSNFYNIAQSLEEMARRDPFRPAIIFPAGRDKKHDRAQYIQFTFHQLNQLCDSYAHGLSGYGIRRGTRTLMMVRQGIELIAVTFALLKIGAVPVLIDPGMGRKAFLQCVTETEPTAFIGIPLAHALRSLFPRSFKTITHHVTVGKRWFWGGATLDELQVNPHKPFAIAPTTVEDEVAVAFTSGSTGIPKGVIFQQGTFRAVISFFQNEIGMAAGEVDLPGLPILALLNPAFGVTTVVPDMDPRKPAEVNPARLIEAIQTHGVTTSFGSPTIWKRVAHYCRENKIELPSMKRIFMAGAPVPPWLIEEFRDIAPNGEVLTPFGATEALPISNFTGSEILAETASLTTQGWGVCVGFPLQGVQIRVIQLTDNPIAKWDESLVQPAGEVGEIVVKGPVVTREYLNRPAETARAKIQDNDGIWHRMGDVGYFDNQGRLWMCGRKSHRVETEDELLLPVPCEAIFNTHPEVARTALVGIGPYGQQRPALVVESKNGQHPSKTDRQRLVDELLVLGQQYEHTRSIRDILFHKSFPVDVRHNAKIRREALAEWAAKQLG